MKQKKSVLIISLIILIYIILLGALCLVEKTNPAASITSFGKAFWYSLTTLSTVGYGDMFPVTFGGKIIGGCFILLSLGILSFFLSFFLQLFSGTLLPYLQLHRLKKGTLYLFSDTNERSISLALSLAQNKEVHFLFMNTGKEQQELLTSLQKKASVVCLVDDITLLKNVFCHIPLCFMLLKEAEAANLSDLTALSERFTEADFYCLSSTLLRENFENTKIHFINTSETIARTYCKEHPLLPSELSVAILGFSSLGQSLLTQALLTNIYQRDTGFSYHIFGDSTEFTAFHTQLDNIAAINTTREGFDSIYFHSYQELSQIQEIDRVILCVENETESLKLLGNISHYFVTKQVDIYLENASLKPLFVASNQAIRVFGETTAIFTEALILQQALNERAQMIHCTYWKNNIETSYQAMPIKDCLKLEAFQKDWNTLSHFTRYSNISQADYMPVMLQIVAAMVGKTYIPGENEAQIATAYSTLSSKQKIELEKLEHIRWNRYHYLNNWSYAPERNNAKKQHPSLVDFEALSVPEQEKDAGIWKTIQEIFILS